MFAGLFRNADFRSLISSSRFLNGYSVKLSMERYVQRSKAIDLKIETMAERIALLRQKTLVQAIQTKENTLETENQQLKRDIDELKTRIKMAEIRNGVPQVPLPKMAPIAKRQPPATGKGKAIVESKAAGDSTGTSAVPPVKKPKADKPGKKTGGGNKKPPTGEAPVDVSRLDLRIARIVKAEKHPDADTLYIEDIETGEEKNRTVISGLVKFVPIEEMQNRMVVLMMNLKPVKMRGIFSQAMVMCASSPENVEILVPPPGCVPGDRVTFEGYPGEPDAQLNPKKKVWDQIQPDLRTDANKVACYRGVPFTVEGKGVVTAQTMANSNIK